MTHVVHPEKKDETEILATKLKKLLSGFPWWLDNSIY